MIDHTVNFFANLLYELFLSAGMKIGNVLSVVEEIGVIIMSL